VTPESVADSLLGDIPDLERQICPMLSICDNDCRRKISGTYPDHPILGRSCEQFAVWAKTYTHNIHLVRIVRSFIDQDAVQQ